MMAISKLLQIVAGKHFSLFKILLRISETFQTNWNQIKMQSAETAADVCWIQFPICHASRLSQLIQQFVYLSLRKHHYQEREARNWLKSTAFCRDWKKITSLW